MSKKNRKKYYQKNLNNRNKSKNINKKVLNGVDLANNYNNFQKEIIENEIKLEEKVNKKIETKENKFNINEHIQTFISILFSIIIFVALSMLIFVIYNNYLKKDDNSNCRVEEVCKDFIKKDYNINEDYVLSFLMNLRGIIYNIQDFDKEKVDNNTYLNLATYFVWNNDSEYLMCNHEIDSNCLITKKEMKKELLMQKLKKYFGLNDINVKFYNEFNDEDIRIYELEENIVVTFNEFEYQTLKHDLIDIRIDEDRINVLFALSENLTPTDYYKYVGYKNIQLKYIDNNFIIENIKTSLIEK